jgi:hypothetical protein
VEKLVPKIKTQAIGFLRAIVHPAHYGLG